MPLLHSNRLYNNKMGGCSSPNNLNGDNSNGGSLSRGKLPRDRHGDPNNLHSGGSPNNLNGDRVSRNNRSNKRGDECNRNNSHHLCLSTPIIIIMDGEYQGDNRSS